MKKVLLLALFLAPALASAASVDLFYRGETYVPPFYLGGAQWTNESRIDLLAIPQGLGDPKSLTYKWRQGTTVLGDESGVGRNMLSFSDSVLSKPQTISVQIVDGNDNVLAQSYVNLVPQAPDLLIYEKHPLYGFLFNLEASRGYALSSGEVTFAAFPLFFSTPSRDAGGLSYAWSSSAGTDSTQSTVTYRAPDNAAGSASIAVKASNPATLRQASSKNFLVQFGNQNE